MSRTDKILLAVLIVAVLISLFGCAVPGKGICTNYWVKQARAYGDCLDETKCYLRGGEYAVFRSYRELYPQCFTERQ